MTTGRSGDFSPQFLITYGFTSWAVVVVVNCVIAIFALVVAVGAFLRAAADHLVLNRKINELEQKAAALSSRLKERGALAGEIAHEIKNPISAILCSAEALDVLIGPRLEESHRKCLHYIREYGENLLHMVGDFLDLSRAETGDIKLDPQPLELMPAVQTAVSLLQSKSIKKHVNIKCVEVEGSLIAYADSRYLRQVVFNLLQNAIRFSPERGEVQIVIESDFPEKWVRVSMSDNGPGIPAEKLAELFNPYSDPGKSLQEGGSLGLAVCKSLVEMSGGKLEVHSEAGRGTRFDIVLPQYVAPAVTESEKAKLENFFAKAIEAHRPLAGQAFLLVHQDDGMRDSAAKLIESWGGVVDQVDLATDAVRALSQKTYSAVMVDEGEDALKLARKVREDDSCRNTKIIFASDDAACAVKAREAGADSCVKKPLNGRKLLESLLVSPGPDVEH